MEQIGDAHHQQDKVRLETERGLVLAHLVIRQVAAVAGRRTAVAKIAHVCRWQQPCEQRWVAASLADGELMWIALLHLRRRHSVRRRMLVQGVSTGQAVANAGYSEAAAICGRRLEHCVPPKPASADRPTKM
jgi:hypothetical protein